MVHADSLGPDQIIDLKLTQGARTLRGGSNTEDTNSTLEGSCKHHIIPSPFPPSPPAETPHKPCSYPIRWFHGLHIPRDLLVLTFKSTRRLPASQRALQIIKVVAHRLPRREASIGTVVVALILVALVLLLLRLRGMVGRLGRAHVGRRIYEAVVLEFLVILRPFLLVSAFSAEVEECYHGG
ncbi:hypothetical protein RRF57_005974 [Xylaria bambusicola]|uniref:Uncharacterized protein n=1 Tax=Xylaria bambusicola TaxID=326684 RepID=A0AAN7UYR3_9PEZI